MPSFLERIAAWEVVGTALGMDLYARARILEAAKGMPKWSFSRDVQSNPMVMYDEGPAMFPEVHPDWFSSRDQGMYDAVLGGAQEVLKSFAGEATAEEIAQNMASGLSVGGGTRSDVYGDLGKKEKNAILSGRRTPKQLKTSLWGWAKNRAMDVWRKQRRRDDARELTHPALIHPGVGAGVSAETALDRTPNEVMLSVISGPDGRSFREWVWRTLKTKATEIQMVIINISLDWARDRDEWPSANRIRNKVMEALGRPISIRKINEHRKTVQKMLKREMERNPQVLGWIEERLEFAQLGYGGGSLRLAKMAKRVADRFLQTPSV